MRFDVARYAPLAAAVVACSAAGNSTDGSLPVSGTGAGANYPGAAGFIGGGGFTNGGAFPGAGGFGVAAQGGNVATGGAVLTGEGGIIAQGGAGLTGQGGIPETGGTPPFGGFPTTGGAPPFGGFPTGGVASGGFPSTGGVASGGFPSTGGDLATGGAPSTGGGASTGPLGDVNALRQACADTINQYRATLGLAPMSRASASVETCSDEGAQSDATTGMAHGSAGNCPGMSAQDTCPGWSPTQYGGVVNALKACLQGMWAEGEPSEGRDQCIQEYFAGNQACFLAHGHYLNMSNPAYSVVSCGFYVMSNGKVWMNQDLGK
jgi:hypothetical protein